MSVRLEWEGKTWEVPRFRLPLQVVETINTPRADRGTIFGASPQSIDPPWRNMLIWADNIYALGSLIDELAGKIDLIYIDPPFDSRQDYKVRISVGEEDFNADQDLAKLSSLIEEKAYRDTWGKGVESYLQMLYSRLVILHELLSEQGSLFLHLAPNVSHLARVLLDELFKPENFRAEIIWQRTTAHADTKDFGGIHDSILCYSKSANHLWSPQFRPYDESYLKSHYSYKDPDGRRFRLSDLTAAGIRKGVTGQPWRGFDPNEKGRHWGNDPATLDRLDKEGRIYWPPKEGGWPAYKRYLDEMPGMPIGDIWDDVYAVNPQAKERLGYDTQKPEALLERIIKSSSADDSIVLDCFAGSGTTAAVAEKLGRRWVAIDIGRFAIHTTRKRLLDLPGCSPFVVGNLGRYERQVWQQATTGDEISAYLNFMVDLYRAEPLAGYVHLHGAAGPRAVHVGGVDAPITGWEIKDALGEAEASGYPALDVLGWEFEMGLHELAQAEAKARGIALSLRRIPREIMDPRVVAAGDVIFHELAFVDVRTRVRSRTLTVVLNDFLLSNPDLLPEGIRSKIRTWSDYIDYWAVDFDYRGTFHSHWQSFRTRADRRLELEAYHEYDGSGEREIVTKVVDIFGNDTTTKNVIIVK